MPHLYSHIAPLTHVPPKKCVEHTHTLHTRAKGHHHRESCGETHMEAEFSAVLVIGEAEHRCGAAPQGPAAVSVALVLLQQLQKLHEHDAISQHQHIQLLQVSFLQHRERERTI